MTVGDHLSGLATEIRERLGPVAALDSAPLISIVVLNRDGEEHLRRLLAGLVERTDYPDFELIVVDNGSSDGSLGFLRTVEAPFPISILANPDNESFSDANNQGAEAAVGELLLFLNNDVEPFETGWLRELVTCLAGSGAGAVGATLICPETEHERSFEHGYGVQHRGLAFRGEERAEPVLRGWEDDPLDDALGKDAPCDAVAAACMLISNSAFERAGGFFPGYFYGCEDVDLCLKLKAAGLTVWCSGRAIAVHHPASTRREMPFAEARGAKRANRILLWKRWGPHLHHDRGPISGPRRPPAPLLQHPEARLNVSFDHLVALLMLRRPDVFFVQIGAFDGKTSDQLYPYVTGHGWRGIAVEPQPHYFAQLQNAYAGYPGVELRNVAVAESAGKRTLYAIDPDVPDLPAWSGGLASFDRSWVARAGVRGPEGEDIVRELTVECVTLPELLAGVAQIDLLQIDVEGFDAEIIRLFPFDTHRPSVVCFESLGLDHVAHDGAVQRLIDHGYKLAISGVDTIAWSGEPQDHGPTV